MTNKNLTESDGDKIDAGYHIKKQLIQNQESKDSVWDLNNLIQWHYFSITLLN